MNTLSLWPLWKEDKNIATELKWWYVGWLPYISQHQWELVRNSRSHAPVKTNEVRLRSIISTVTLISIMILLGKCSFCFLSENIASVLPSSKNKCLFVCCKNYLLHRNLSFIWVLWEDPNLPNTKTWAGFL